MPRYRWREPERVPEMARELAVHPLLAAVLYRRGIRNHEEVRRFLQPHLSDLPDPAALPDSGRAVSLVEEVRCRSRPVVVFGDYDVDGLTATTLLAQLFGEFGLTVIPMVPHRLRDGYGFQRHHVPGVLEHRPALLVTVDCGTGDWDALRDVLRAGVPVIVLDHHAVHDEAWPDELAFVSVARPDAPPVFRTLSAVGVAYQFARLLLGNEAASRWLPLVALGTVADVVPLVGINRTLVALGLKRFWETAPLGLRTLARLSGLDSARGQRLTSWHCGYVLGPRLNAAGRMDDPRLALELLLTADAQRAEELARKLNELNALRQRAIERMLAEAEQRIDALGSLPPVLVLADSAWSVGLVGLAASKLVSRYARPVVLLARESEVSRGSARSIDGFDIAAALARCRDLLIDHGGHHAAAGLTVETERIAELEARLLEIAAEHLGQEEPALPLELDAELHPYQIALETWEVLAQLEPYGHGNPVPRFLVRDVRAVDITSMQNERHLRFTVVAPDGTVRQAIWFEGGREIARLARAGRIDIAFTLRRSDWNGQERVELDVIDIRPTR